MGGVRGRMRHGLREQSSLVAGWAVGVGLAVLIVGESARLLDRGVSLQMCPVRLAVGGDGDGVARAGAAVRGWYAAAVIRGGCVPHVMDRSCLGTPENRLTPPCTIWLSLTAHTAIAVVCGNSSQPV